MVVCESGEIVCMSGEDLKILWTANSKSALQDAVASPIDTIEIEFASFGDIADFREGVFRRRPEIFSALPKALDSDPSLLFLVVNTVLQNQRCRHLMVLAVAHGIAATSPDTQKLIPLDVSPLSNGSAPSNSATVYQVDIQAGILLELADSRLNCYDITNAVPKQKSSIFMQDAQSFSRLQRPLLLCASSSSLVLYNHHYQSVHGSAELDLSELPADHQGARRCQLVTHLRSQDLAIALVDNILVSVHVEPPSHHGKRRKEGLLIDSIGRGSLQGIQAKRQKYKLESREFSRLLPGSITDAYLAEFQSETKTADEFLLGNELALWENLLRQKFVMDLSKESETSNIDASEEPLEDLREWSWLNRPEAYPAVDRRWVIYAISRVFSVQAAASDGENIELRLTLPDSNVTTYLVVAGHLTVSNLISAFRDELHGNEPGVKRLASDVIRSLVDADPSMALLLNYLQATKLGEVELLLCIRSLMLNMELLPDSSHFNRMKLLTSEVVEGTEVQDVDLDDLDDLERELAVMEHHLGDDSSSRSRGLTLAFTKLWRMPAVATVKALRATIDTEDLLAFIYLLRVELIRGAWTSLYLDPAGPESERNEPPPDGVIALIADLLGRCLDAVGAGGWLFNDAMSWTDKTEAGNFLSILKREVNVALEGIEEAVRLNSLVGEAARFGLTVEKKWLARQSSNPNKPRLVQFENTESRLLPLGLKTKVMPSREKVVAGGEVVRRSARQTGHLLSQNVEAYSIEKLIV